MKTRSISRAEMDERIARFDELTTWAVQRDERVPQAARDLIYARRLVAVAVPAALEGPFKNPAAISGTDFSLPAATSRSERWLAPVLTRARPRPCAA